MPIENYNMSLMPPSFEPWSPKQDKSKQVAVLMSGGVDSSVTASLLRDDGWDVLGITMKIPVACTNARGCCGADAAFVCHELGLPHYFVDVTEAFRKLIIEPFQASYARGHTPSPCIDCNTLLKFTLVWDFVTDSFGIEYVATGHYARVLREDGTARLARAKDKSKDQSYFLYGIPAERLDKILLPLGDYSKPQIRKLASKLNLSVAEKAESMELCFAGEGDYRQALDGGQKDVEGDLTDFDGNKIGIHKGISNYTMGQRRGLGFAGRVPLYVVRIDAVTNTVALGTKEQVSTDTVIAAEINILIPEEFSAGSVLSAKIRSGGEPYGCKLISAEPNAMTVKFDKPQFAPTPGQRIVLYDNRENIIAGGTITY
ncbi:MAG TPA: tRNA 2-thiouridine(34) synthase MnmA [Phycisphaerales bacterium]|nr:tRNA 2-thiouridine(34) synthase MnmA [Phycisphaerales bacterium]